MGDERLAAIEAAHEPSEHPGRYPEYGTDHTCVCCSQRWPCDAAILLARLREAERERDVAQEANRGLADVLAYEQAKVADMMGERDYAVAPAAVVADGEALARLPRGFIAVLVDASEGYSASLEWQDERYTRHTTHGTGPSLAAAVAAALDGGGE